MRHAKGHAIMLALLATAWMVRYAHPTETHMPPQVKQDVASCVTPQMVVDRMGTMQPAYNFTGAELRAWNTNFHAMTGLDAPPNVDRIVIYGNFDNNIPQEQALFLAFAGPCLFNAVVLPVPVVQRILQGNGA